MRHLLFAVFALIIPPAAGAELSGCRQLHGDPSVAVSGSLDISGPSIVGRGPLLLAGIEEAIGGGTADIQIDGLWTRFEQRNQWITNAESDARTGVCLNAGADSSFDYFGGQVLAGPAGELPEVFSSVELPAARYAVFVLTGSADDIVGAQALIYRTLLGEAALNAADAPDLVVFPPRFSPRHPRSRIELWVPLAP